MVFAQLATRKWRPTATPASHQTPAETGCESAARVRDVSDTADLDVATTLGVPVRNHHRSDRREDLDAAESHHRLDLLAEPLRDFIEHRAVSILGSYCFDVDEQCCYSSL